jgi:hypothetical protein
MNKSEIHQKLRKHEKISKAEREYAEKKIKKYCNWCNTEKKLKEFGRSNAHMLGYSAYCKECYRQKAKENYYKKKKLSSKLLRAQIKKLKKLLKIAEENENENE